MAVVTPTFRSTSGDQRSRSIGYRVLDATDDIDALDAVEIAAPLTYDGLVRDNIQIDEIAWPDKWTATVTYSKQSRPPVETGETEYSFDIGVENLHIIQSNSTVDEYVASGTATDFKGAIAVDTDGVPQGVDVRTPVSSFQVAFYPAIAVVTSAWQKSVRELVGKVNSTTFFDHAAGEVLFVGCSGRARSAADWELNFRFEVRPNKTGLTIGDISGIDVDGWDVLWVHYKRSTDGATHKYIRTPSQVNIERVYERADLAGELGFG